MGYVVHTPEGSYCAACQAVLTQEEIDFECCDCCGGEGFVEDFSDDPINLQGSGPAPIALRHAQDREG